MRREFHLAITGSQVITKFTVAEAHHYVSQNAVRAIRVFNTRLADFSSETISPQYMTARNLQDEGFLEAIKRGTEYHLVYDQSQNDNVLAFLEQIYNYKFLGEAGLVHVHPVRAYGMPLIQFIILEYNAYQECLIGYGLGREIATARDIYLIRSDMLCAYLRHVHDNYIAMLSDGVYG